MKACFEMKDVSPKTQMHLRDVYGNLSVCTAICALAMYMNAFTILSGWIWSFVTLLGMGYMMYKITNVNDTTQNRIGYLWALSFCMGFLVGPAMHKIAEFNPMILVQAASYTAIVFGSFTAMALFSKRRSYLFLGGIISSIMSAMFWYRMMSWMFGYSDGFGMVYLMSGLFTACLYIIYDTQIIIEMAERGDKDVPKHTMMLFMDLFDLFIKIVQLLLELQNQQEKKKNKKRDD